MGSAAKPRVDADRGVSTRRRLSEEDCVGPIGLLNASSISFVSVRSRLKYDSAQRQVYHISFTLNVKRHFTKLSKSRQDPDVNCLH